ALVSAIFVGLVGWLWSPSVQAAQQADLSNLERQASASPNDPKLWEQLGVAYMQEERYEDAKRSLQRAIDTGLQSPVAKYNLACALARLGEKERAIDLLVQVVNSGASVPFANDPDLASLTSEPRFQQLLAQARQNAHPCKDPKRAEYRQLDFW